jgi:hypothetical protein
MPTDNSGFCFKRVLGAAFSGEFEFIRPSAVAIALSFVYFRL